MIKNNSERTNNNRRSQWVSPCICIFSRENRPVTPSYDVKTMSVDLMEDPIYWQLDFPIVYVHMYVYMIIYDPCISPKSSCSLLLSKFLFFYYPLLLAIIHLPTTNWIYHDTLFPMLQAVKTPAATSEPSLVKGFLVIHHFLSGPSIENRIHEVELHVSSSGCMCGHRSIIHHIICT